MTMQAARTLPGPASFIAEYKVAHPQRVPGVFVFLETSCWGCAIIRNWQLFIPRSPAAFIYYLHPVLQTLQASRAFAAISVAAFHLSITMSLTRYGGQAAFSDYTRYLGGARFFFVLSGFILLLVHARDIAPAGATVRSRLGLWKHYIYRRFVRVYPIYWLYTLPFVVLVALGFGTDAKIPQDFLGWLSSVTLIRFSATAPPLTVAWSLFHEIAFYLLFSVLLLNRRTGVACFAILGMVCLALYQYPRISERDAWHVYTSAHNLYFLVGMGGYWLYKRGGNGWIETILGAVMSIAGGIAVRVLHEDGLLLLVSGFALLIAGLGKLERNGSVTIPKWLVLIGNASYSLYLIHEQVQGLVLKACLKLGIYQTLGASFCYVLAMLGCIVAGVIAFKLIEEPLLDALRRWEKRRKASAAEVLAKAA
ncbi:acyltransferase family protein [Pseudoduganella chitinolytica]|uniref:Acyltransferase n=1 Tax=Pseudoduganella chitinolytica TaxID=34070 RepID=A0ABY8BCU2_9BURK|nr:acyltransferase [Pseudoduganella chitinolytica]WEF33218.1 acyltransferase [Pseudoduganella chitinolytica]